MFAGAADAEAGAGSHGQGPHDTGGDGGTPDRPHGSEYMCTQASVSMEAVICHLHSILVLLQFNQVVQFICDSLDQLAPLTYPLLPCLRP